MIDAYGATITATHRVTNNFFDRTYYTSTLNGTFSASGPTYTGNAEIGLQTKGDLTEDQSLLSEQVYTDEYGQEHSFTREKTLTTTENADIISSQAYVFSNGVWSSTGTSDSEKTTSTVVYNHMYDVRSPDSYNYGYPYIYVDDYDLTVTKTITVDTSIGQNSEHFNYTETDDFFREIGDPNDHSNITEYDRLKDIARYEQQYDGITGATIVLQNEYTIIQEPEPGNSYEYTQPLSSQQIQSVLQETPATLFSTTPDPLANPDNISPTTYTWIQTVALATFDVSDLPEGVELSTEIDVSSNDGGNGPSGSSYNGGPLENPTWEGIIAFGQYWWDTGEAVGDWLTEGRPENSSAWPGGWLNPGNAQRWLYTGDAFAAYEVFNDALIGAGEGLPAIGFEVTVEITYELTFLNSYLPENLVPEVGLGFGYQVVYDWGNQVDVYYFSGPAIAMDFNRQSASANVGFGVIVIQDLPYGDTGALEGFSYNLDVSHNKKGIGAYYGYTVNNDGVFIPDLDKPKIFSVGLDLGTPGDPVGGLSGSIDLSRTFHAGSFTW
ncbi:hypothetical protein [Calycomorphotria hydatis]|uniref:Uncharacterized protein n=1 Tax=Calycomorphotria hydatis TaxID=2528027 RepID=A0A517T8Q0_9PLAN|nr:hypothetical protein [Calycomorphotria hydatis]QDT64762.1 hypothetical protein V22_20030 [Calycomorphotria hydatis]